MSTVYAIDTLAVPVLDDRDAYEREQQSRADIEADEMAAMRDPEDEARWEAEAEYLGDLAAAEAMGVEL